MLYRWLICLSLFAVGSLAGPARGGTLTFKGDGNVSSFITSAGEEPKAEFRSGDNGPRGDWELGWGNDTQSAGQAQFANNTWNDGAAKSFSIDLSATDVSLTFDGQTYSPYVGSIGLPGNDLLIRVRTEVDSSISLTSLTVNGAAVSDLINGLSDSGGSDASYLLVNDAFAGSTANISGLVSFAWNTTSIPSGSRLDVSFKAVDAVPSPSGMAGLLTLAVVRLVGRSRRRG